MHSSGPPTRDPPVLTPTPSEPPNEFFAVIEQPLSQDGHEETSACEEEAAPNTPG